MATISSSNPRPEYDDSDEEHDTYCEFYFPSKDARWVDVILKDGHDTNGTGLKVGLAYSGMFGNIFDHFKARSCKNCRALDDMRFTTEFGKVSEYDTPEKLGLLNNSTLEITVWSSFPGLQCETCKSMGYPSTLYIDRTLQYKTAVLPDQLDQADIITLLVSDQTGFETSVRMLNTVGFQYLVDQYRANALRYLDACYPFFNNEWLVATDTPKKLGMVNYDRVWVVIE